MILRSLWLLLLLAAGPVYAAGDGGEAVSPTSRSPNAAPLIQQEQRHGIRGEAILRNALCVYDDDGFGCAGYPMPYQVEAIYPPGHEYCIFDMKPGHDSVHFGNRCLCQKDRFDLKRSEIDFSMDPGTDVFPQIGFVPFAFRQRNFR